MYHKSLYPPLPEIPPQNVHNVLFNRPEQADWPDYPVHINAVTGVTRSFRQFLETVRDGATAMGSDIKLGGLGMRAESEELVGVLCENSMDCLALLHSLLVMTVPFVMFSAYSTPFEFKNTFKLAGPMRLFVTPTFLPLALTSGLPRDRIHVIEGNIEGHASYGELVAHARDNRLPRLPVRKAESETLAYLAFSSGTTGPPKGVMISHGNLINSLSQIFVFSAEALKVKPPPIWNGPEGLNVIFNVLPIHHVYGLHITTFRCFFVPTTLVILPKWNADVFFDSISKYRVTSLYLVPSLVHQIVHHLRFPITDFSNIQFVNCGAAYLPVSLAEQLRSRFPGVERVGEGYGMSECVGIAKSVPIIQEECLSSPLLQTLSISLKPGPGMLEGRAKHVPGSVGMLLPGIEARVVREDGQLAALNEPGELHVRSGSVALGYWKNQKATDETFRDGWLRTGDRMRIDANGVLYFEDRAKDTLKISGMQVSPTEIEETLLRHPDDLIIDVAVAGVSGGRTADERVPRAWIVLSAQGKVLGATEVVTRLDAWVREALSRYKWLRGGIGIVSQIPKSPTGKVLRRVLVDEYEAERRSRTARL